MGARCRVFHTRFEEILWDPALTFRARFLLSSANWDGIHLVDN